jgi:hypothetical protein
MNYWIKSNTGDWIRENNGNYELNIIERHYKINGETIKIQSEHLKITEVDFRNLKGFIPIKPKKLWTRIRSWYRGEHKYESSGKGLEPTRVLTKTELREKIINNLLNEK